MCFDILINNEQINLKDLQIEFQKSFEFFMNNFLIFVEL